MPGTVDDLHHDGKLEHQSRVALAARDHLPARLGHSGSRERLALAHPVGAERCRGGCDRMNDSELVGDPRRDRGGAVAPRGDDPAERERGGEALDRRLVLDRDDAAAIGEGEPRRARVAVADRGPDAERPCGPQEPELRRARPEDE